MRWSATPPKGQNPDLSLQTLISSPPPLLLTNPNPNPFPSHTKMSKTLIPFLLLLLLLISSSSLPTLSSLPTISLDTFLSDQSRRDPLASNDSFHSLPSSLKKSLSLPSPSSLLSSLLSLQISVPVFVKLVGPFSSAAPSLLHSFTAAALSSAQFHTIGAKPHHLSELNPRTRDHRRDRCEGRERWSLFDSGLYPR